MASWHLDWVPYERSFVVPLQSARGWWYERRGLILRAQSPDGRVGWGEIAPLPEFGSETWMQALAFLDDHAVDALQDLNLVPAHLPATRAALETARWSAQNSPVSFRYRNSVLLPTSDAAVEQLRRGLNDQFTCYKLKLGVKSPEEELALVEVIWESLPADGELRLDANASFDERRLRWWLEHLQGLDRISYMEQPLPPGEEAVMAALMREFHLPIALDESLIGDGLETFLREPAWPGPLVLKPSLLGALGRLGQRLAPLADQLVISSAFETGIGLYQNLAWASSLGVKRAVGYGTLAYFDDGWNGFDMRPELTSADLGPEFFEEIWTQACQRWSHV